MSYSTISSDNSYSLFFHKMITECLINKMRKIQDTMLENKRAEGREL